MNRSRVLSGAVAAWLLATLVAVSPASAMTAIVANSGWKTSTDPDLAGLSLRLTMSRVSGAACDFLLVADFDWAAWMRQRLWNGSLQTPDFIGITVTASPAFLRVANSQHGIGTWSTY